MSDQILNHYVDFMLYRLDCDNETGVRTFYVELDGNKFTVLFCYDNGMNMFSVIVRKGEDGKTKGSMFDIGYHSDIINWTRATIYEM